MIKKGEATKLLIKEKAYILFARKGFKEVTMKDICEAAGLSRGGLYGHYGSTEQIFKEIINNLMGRQDEEFLAGMEAGVPAVKILDGVLERYLNEMIDSDSSLSVAVYEFFSTKNHNAEGNAIYEQYLLSAKMWKKLIRYGIDRDEFHHVDVQAVFDLIVFSYQGVRMYSRLMTVERKIPEGIIGQIQKILVKSE